MSSCSTAEKSSTSALGHVPDEAATSGGSYSSNVLLNLGAGYTAPPPTPMASAADNPLLSTHIAAAGSSAVLNNCTHDGEEYGADEDEKAHINKSTQLAPTRADLDALAHYLMQQSLLSTPTLRLASPRSQQQKRRSPTCSSGPLTEAGATAASTNIDIYGTAIGEQKQVINGKRLSITVDEHAGDVAAVAAQVYSYACGSMSVGFCEESRQGIRKACQEMGTFYINVAEQEMNFKRDDGAALLPTLLRCSSNILCVGSGPLVPLSEFLMINQTPQTCCTPLFFQDDPQAAGIDTNFRETMTKYAKLLFDISKDLVKLLLEDLCVETQTNIRAHSLKPLLHIYNNGKHEKSNNVRHDDDDNVVFSLSHGIVNHQGNKNVLLLAKVGNQLQTWSEGKYKAPSLHSLCNVECGEICVQLDLMQHH